jgi:hypothetical protein
MFPYARLNRWISRWSARRSSRSVRTRPCPGKTLVELLSTPALASRSHRRTISAPRSNSRAICATETPARISDLTRCTSSRRTLRGCWKSASYASRWRSSSDRNCERFSALRDPVFFPPDCQKCVRVTESALELGHRETVPVPGNALRRERLVQSRTRSIASNGPNPRIRERAGSV